MLVKDYKQDDDQSSSSVLSDPQVLVIGEFSPCLCHHKSNLK